MISDFDKIQLTDHYPIAAKSLGYHGDKFKSNEGKRGRKKTTQDTEGHFYESAPDTLKRIEKCWTEEADTGKRERGNLYGLAGTKMNLLPRKEAKLKRAKSLPGLDNWLSTANEYEKQVVHSFISQMSDAYKNPDENRPNTSPASLPEMNKPKSRGNSRKNTRLITPNVEELKTTALTPKPPSTAGSMARTPSRYTSSSQSSRSSNAEVQVKKVSTQLPIPNSDAKPSSPLYEAQRPATVPSTPNEHNCQNCETCKKKMLKRMIDDMSGKELSAYDELLEEKAQNQLRAVHPQLYQFRAPPYEDDDYLHHGCNFQNVAPRTKGYFTIHPEFVSEKIVDMKKLRKKHDKYFGESKRPTL